MNRTAMAEKISGRLRLVFTCGLLAALALVLAPAMVANAGTITVTNTNDSGVGSLRQAIADAGIGEEITFADDVTGTITLTSGELYIDKNLTITGPGADVLTISGNNSSRVFYVGVEVTVTISGITIANGYSADDGGDSGWGGGIINYGTLTLNNCTVSGNTADSAGGGIYNAGIMLTLNNSTVSGNTMGYGGGIYNTWTAILNNSVVNGNSSDGWGGGIHNDSFGTLTLNNSTVSGNNATYGGGGIYNAGTLTLNNSTVSSNSANSDKGGGIYNSYGGYDGVSVTNVKNTIIADNNAATAGPDFYGNVTSYGCNLVEDTSGCMISGDQTGNIYLKDPLLGPLQDNGGPTFTQALLNGSPAIDGVSTDCGCTTVGGATVTTDQRGEPRPADGNDDGSDLCDIGAYELQPPTAPGPPRVPTLNHWGVATVIAVFAVVLVWTARRRSVAKAAT